MTTKIDWIKSQLLPKETASNAASRLNAIITIDNPNPRQDVPAPIDFYALREDIIPDDEAGKVLNSLIWDRITAALAVGDFRTVNNHLSSLVGVGFVSLPTVAKLQEFMSQTIPDPNYQETIWSRL